jgi:LysM repeat protein
MCSYRHRSAMQGSASRRALSAACLLLPVLLTCAAAAAADTTELEARLTQLQALYDAGERERLRLAAENARLDERLQALDAQQLLSKRLEEQAERLERVSQRLERGVAAPDVPESPDAFQPLVREDETAGLRTELEVTQRRLQLLMEQFAEAHRMRLDALGKLTAANTQLAELNARLQQQQQEMAEALLRAEKAEKLYAGLEDTHARILTENERLTLELATAKARQAEALQRVVELDTRLATSQARASAADGAPPAVSVDGAAVKTPPETAVSAEPAVTPRPAVEPTIERATEPAAEPRTEPATEPANQSVISPVIYQVRPDDTLSRISAQVYGDASAWPRIFEANRDLLDSPNDLELGMKLVIP